MKKNTLNVLFIAAISPFLIQCASQSDVEDIRYQLRIVNKKLEDMKANTVSQIQKRQAASSGQMDQVELRILELKSQLDETNHLNRRLSEHNKDLEHSISAIAVTEAAKREEIVSKLQREQQAKASELTLLNQKLRLQNENIQAIQDARIREAEMRVKSAARAAELARAKAKAANAATRSRSGVRHILADKKKIKFKVTKKSVTSTKSTSKPLPVVTAKAASPKSQETISPAKDVAVESGFSKAQKLFNKKKYSAAYDLFELIATTPSSNNSVDARFMMGECYFKQKEYDKAIMQYQKIISQHPGHTLASSSMLQQGMAFERLADKDTAKVIYKKILKKHGSSQEAIKAQERLTKL